AGSRARSGSGDVASNPHADVSAVIRAAKTTGNSLTGALIGGTPTKICPRCSASGAGSTSPGAPARELCRARAFCLEAAVLPVHLHAGPSDRPALTCDTLLVLLRRRRRDACHAPRQPITNRRRKRQVS